MRRCRALRHRFIKPEQFNFLGEYELSRAKTRTLRMLVNVPKPIREPAARSLSRPSLVQPLSKDRKLLTYRDDKTHNDERGSSSERSSLLSSKLILKSIYSRKRSSKLSPIAARSLNFLRSSQRNLPGIG